MKKLVTIFFLAAMLSGIEVSAPVADGEYEALISIFNEDSTESIETPVTVTFTDGRTDLALEGIADPDVHSRLALSIPKAGVSVAIPYLPAEGAGIMSEMDYGLKLGQTGENIRLRSNLGIGTTADPVTPLEVDGIVTLSSIADRENPVYNVNPAESSFMDLLRLTGGLRLETSGSIPACNSGNRGLVWLVQDPDSVQADSLILCVKLCDTTYSWVTLYSNDTLCNTGTLPPDPLDNVLICYDNGCGSVLWQYPYSDVMDSLGWTYTQTTDVSSFTTQLTGGTAWDLVIYVSYHSGGPYTDLETYLGSGGKLIYIWCSFTTNSFYTAMDVEGVSGSYSGTARDFYAWESGHVLMTTPNSLPTTLDASLDPCGFGDGHTVNILSGGTGIMGYTVSPTVGEAAVVLNSTGRGLYIAEVPWVFNRSVISYFIVNQLFYMASTP